jgi:hypothetical protein
MSFSSSKTTWIHAYKTGSSLDTDSQSATIQQHSQNGMGTFSFDASAQGGTDSNPFLSSTSNTTSSTSGSSGSSGTTTTTIIASGSGASDQHLIVVHAALACAAFAVVFPFGAILIRLASFSGAIWAHAALQGLGFLMYTSAAGIGIYIAKNPDTVSIISFYL